MVFLSGMFYGMIIKQSLGKLKIVLFIKIVLLMIYGVLTTKIINTKKGRTQKNQDPEEKGKNEYVRDGFFLKNWKRISSLKRFIYRLYSTWK